MAPPFHPPPASLPSNLLPAAAAAAAAESAAHLVSQIQQAIRLESSSIVDAVSLSTSMDLSKTQQQPSNSGDKNTFEEWNVQHIDYSDNPIQLDVLRHHYQAELHPSLQSSSQSPSASATTEQLLQDYQPDAVIHQVVDGVPHTYHGYAGVRECLQMSSLSSSGAHQQHPVFELQHIAVNHNHAQVIWQQEVEDPPTSHHHHHHHHHHTRMVGTDSFTFDPQSNRIASQTIVALSSSSSEEEEVQKDEPSPPSRGANE